jgi:hypothetical protein
VLVWRVVKGLWPSDVFEFFLSEIGEAPPTSNSLACRFADDEALGASTAPTHARSSCRAPRGQLGGRPYLMRAAGIAVDRAVRLSNHDALDLV